MSEFQASLDHDHLCRFCAKFSIDTTPLFINDNLSRDLLELANRLLPFEISFCDGLPQKSCETCLACLKSCKQFSDDCIQANEKLQNLCLSFAEEDAQSEQLYSDQISNTEGSESLEKDSASGFNSKEELYPKSSAKYEDLPVINQSLLNQECVNLFDLPQNSPQKTQPPSRSLLCDICGKIFERPNNLRVHKATHLQDVLKKKHVCSHCGKRFSSKFQLTEHQNTHLGLKPHSCDLCDKSFHKRILLRQHKLTHLPESALFECSKCGLRFNRKGNLRAHEKTHSSSRSFICRVCSLSFGDMRSLLSHRRLEHILKKSDETSLVLTEHHCVICKKCFESAETLSLHIKTHQQKENKQVQCKICGQVLKAKALKYHETSKHSNDRPYQCSYCSDNSKVVGFMSFGLLKNHERLHTGHRPFNCDSCEKSFRSKKSLQQHKLKHSNQRNYECSFCSKRFKTNGTLKVHIKIHTGEKLYVCDRCGHPFIQKSDMLKHQQRHRNCGAVTNLPAQPTSIEQISETGSKPDFETIDVNSVMLPEQVQKILTLTNTTILPGNTLIFADQNFVNEFTTDSSLVIKTPPSTFSSEMRNDNFSERRILQSDLSEPNRPSIGPSLDSSGLKAFSTSSIIQTSDTLVPGTSQNIYTMLQSSSSSTVR